MTVKTIKTPKKDRVAELVKRVQTSAPASDKVLVVYEDRSGAANIYYESEPPPPAPRA